MLAVATKHLGAGAVLQKQADDVNGLIRLGPRGDPVDGILVLFEAVDHVHPPFLHEGTLHGSGVAIVDGGVNNVGAPNLR